MWEWGKLIYSNLYKHCYNKAKEWTMLAGSGFWSESIKAAAVEELDKGTRIARLVPDQIADQLAIYERLCMSVCVCVCRRLGHWSMRIIGCKPPVRTQLRILMTQLELEVEQQEE